MNTRPRNLDKYELREMLGRGGMAEVWKAYDTQLQRFVAIKLLHTDLQNDPDFLNRFVREAQVIASLHHPNIVQVFDFQTTTALDSINPIAYMVMEYIEGPNLAEYIRRTSKLGHYPSAEALVQIFAAISRAIDHAHAQGMIHRDIKPANIMLNKHNTTHLPDGEPILTDFGIARLMGTMTGAISRAWMGTPLYTSPEQAMGQTGNKASDLYSLGVILYEICTGTPPFKGENITAIVLQQANATPVAPSMINPYITPALAEVILHSLSKDPQQRYSSASAMTVALAEALNQPIPQDLTPPAFASQTGLTSEPQLTNPTIWTLGTSQPLSPDAAPTALRQHIPNPQTPPPPVYMTPILAPYPAMGSATPSMVQNQSGPYPTMGNATPSMVQNQSGPHPAYGAGNIAPGYVSAPAPAQLPPPPEHRKRQPLLMALVIILVLLIVGSGVGSLIVLTHKSSASPSAATSSIVGHVYFASSGQINPQNANGSNDILTFSLQNLQPPASGNAYYAWLLSDSAAADETYVYLGQINFANGKASLVQYKDPNNANLLAMNSRFLVTEQSIGSNPSSIGPTPDHTAWRYYSAIPNAVKDADGYTLLDHFRHLLASDPILNGLGLPGGLDIWLFRNTEKVFDGSVTARDCLEQPSTACAYNSIVRVLDYLDGDNYVAEDLPGVPIMISVHEGQAALLKLVPGTEVETPKPYIFHINSHLNGIASSVGVTPEQRSLAGQIDDDLNRVNSLLEQVRTDAKQLIAMYNQSANSLLSASALSTFDDMETNARYAFLGQLETNTGQLQGGVVQIYYTSQELITLPISAYTGS